jgi:hypothetical protein
VSARGELPAAVLAFVARQLATYEIDDEGGNIKPTPNERILLADFAIWLLMKLDEHGIILWPPNLGGGS